MHRASVIALSLLGLVAVGCDDTEETPTDCSYVSDSCTTQGEQRCSTDGRTVEVCTPNTDDCLYWGQDQLCGANQACTDAGGSPACVCNDTCETEGVTECNGDVVRQCSVDGFGCRYWTSGANCADGGGTCEVVDGVAQCSGCLDACTPSGALRCNGPMLQTCSLNESGCLLWSDDTDCAADGGECDDTGDTPQCVHECTNACTDGQTHCSGEVVETCGMGGEGCLVWSPTDDCSTHEPEEFCVLSDDGAVCGDQCENRCEPVDARGCNLDAISVCTLIGSGCLDWVAETDCTAMTPPQVCNETGEEPTCVLACTDECTVDDATHCAGTVIEQCTMTSSGCREWLTDSDCAAMTPPHTCNDTSGSAVCEASCSNTCPADGDHQCNVDAIEVCGTGSSGCLEWSVETNCADAGQTCSESTGTPTCVAGCSDVCTPDGSLRCNVNLLEVCADSGSGCLDWTLQTDCGALGQTCDETGTPTCVAGCSDLCTPEGSLRCNVNLLESCSDSGSGCLDWTLDTDCEADGRTCDDTGTPMCTGV